ncbi:hydrogenase iron-sulfur subunit [Chloroflexota bacterium]
MSEQVTEEVIAVKQNEDYCSNCVVCASLCPYEAINKDTETNDVTIDIEKCQVCGLCYATCPAHAIDTFYYDIDSLIRYLEKAKQEYKSSTLVVMCKGSAPDFSGVKNLFGIDEFIPLSVPCVGRIPEEMFLKAIDMGIEKINVLACDEDYCRFQRGSPVTHRKILALNILLEQLGYGNEAITLKQNSLKVKVDTNLCIACGNCVYYCPYDAAKLETGAVSFDLSLCRGCGLCVAMCPAFALDLENWEKDRISAIIPKLASEVKSPKILVFRCQWAVFPPLDDNSSPNVRYIDLPCASRTDVSHVLEAFQNGVDGILIAACPEDECKQEKSSEKAEHTIDKLKERLSQIGLQDRLHFYTAVPRYPEAFGKELEQFIERIKALG